MGLMGWGEAEGGAGQAAQAAAITAQSYGLVPPKDRLGGQLAASRPAETRAASIGGARTTASKLGLVPAVQARAAIIAAAHVTLATGHLPTHGARSGRRRSALSIGGWQCQSLPDGIAPGNCSMRHSVILHPLPLRRPLDGRATVVECHMRLERLLELLEAERIERRGDVRVSYARTSLLSNAHSRLAYDQADELSRAPLDNRDGWICDCILLTAHRALHYVPNGRDREQRWLGYDGRRRRGRRQLVLTGRFGRLGHLRGRAPQRLISYRYSA